MRKTVIASILSAVLTLCAYSQLAAQEAAPADANQEAQRIADRERALRDGFLQDAQIKFDKAKGLLAEGNFLEARKLIEQARDVVPRGPSSDPLRMEIVAALADTYAMEAEDCGNKIVEMPVAQRDWDKCIKLAEQALAINPNDKEIAALVDELKWSKTYEPTAPIKRGVRPDMTGHAREKRQTLNEKLRIARIQLDAGQLDEAEATLKEILVEDKYNIAAYQYMRKVEQQRQTVNIYRRQEATEKYLRQVDDKWGYKIERPRIPVTGGGTQTTAVARPNAEMIRRLNEIVIEEINFKDAELADVVAFLVQQSIQKDPQGVNIIVKDNPAGRNIKSLRMHNTKLIDVLRVVTDLVEMKFVIEPTTIVIVAKDSPYGQELVTRTYPADPTLIQRIVIPGVPLGGGGGIPGDGGVGGIAPGAAPGAGLAVSSADLIAFFREVGLQFPPGSTMKYLPTVSRLVATNTAENLEKLEKLLAELQVGQYQVEIETKFLEVSESTLTELGFQWFLGEFALSRTTKDGRPAVQTAINPAAASFPSSVTPPGAVTHELSTRTQTTGSITTSNIIDTVTGTGSVEVGGNPFTPGAQTSAFTGGLRDLSIVTIGAIDALLGGAGQVLDNRVFSIGGVLTNPQFQVVVKALSRNGHTDLISAPRVTTTLGQPATIKIVTEFIYPTHYAPPQVQTSTSTGGAVAAVTPSAPDRFATREIGVLLTATPVLGADGYTINLSLNPEVSEFLGFIDYGGKIQQLSNNQVIETDNVIKQPIFATRSVITNVAIWDGQTVVLGGLAREDITEINDKVPFFGDIPFIGRLFRSKGKSVGKRNLIIFVTATLIDPAGNRIHPEGATGFLPEQTPAATPGHP